MHLPEGQGTEQQQGLGLAVVRLVEALLALEAVEALAVVVVVVVRRLILVAAGLPHLLAMRTGVGRGAG